jgi:ribosomal protein S18 acetylase RimI-like enzyme
MLTNIITIRDATAEDMPFLKAMNWEAILASPNFVREMGLEKIRQHEDESWANWTLNAEPAFIAVNAEGRRLGAISLKANEKENDKVIGWRFGIGLEADARGQGIGRQLIEHTLQFGRANGARYVSLYVDPANLPAFTLYHKMGFIEIGETHGAIEMRINFAR